MKDIPKFLIFSKITYPDKYDETDYILTYRSFNDELKQLLNESGYVADFQKNILKVYTF